MLWAQGEKLFRITDKSSSYQNDPLTRLWTVNATRLPLHCPYVQADSLLDFNLI